jgi:hypothetical protein
MSSPIKVMNSSTHKDLPGQQKSDDSEQSDAEVDAPHDYPD